MWPLAMEPSSELASVSFHEVSAATGCAAAAAAPAPSNAAAHPMAANTPLAFMASNLYMDHSLVQSRATSIG
jgi:hypothetical protein